MEGWDLMGRSLSLIGTTKNLTVVKILKFTRKLLDFCRQFNHFKKERSFRRRVQL